MSLQAKYGRLLCTLCACLLIFSVFGCADWKFVRKSHLVNIADGIEYVITRVEPRADLSPEEQAKVKRVGEKVLRNARALAEVENESEGTTGEVSGANGEEP